MISMTSRDRAGFNLKNKGQDKDAKTTGETDTDTADSGTQINSQQDNNQLCTKHIMPSFLFLIS